MDGGRGGVTKVKKQNKGRGKTQQVNRTLKRQRLVDKARSVERCSDETITRCCKEKETKSLWMNQKRDNTHLNHHQNL